MAPGDAPDWLSCAASWEPVCGARVTSPSGCLRVLGYPSTLLILRQPDVLTHCLLPRSGQFLASGPSPLLTSIGLLPSSPPHDAVRQPPQPLTQRYRDTAWWWGRGRGRAGCHRCWLARATDAVSIVPPGGDSWVPQESHHHQGPANATTVSAAIAVPPGSMGGGVAVQRGWGGL